MTRPTYVRFAIAGLLTLMACLLYLDRYAVGIASESMRVDLKMTQTQMSWFLSAFFWSYALCQVPAGWLSDRYGPRIMLTAYILGWSLFTGLLGVTTQVGMVLLLRFLCGAAQAGAYPVCSGMIRHWFPVSGRGAASSIVAMGGRSGAVLAPILTAALMIAFAGGWRPVLIVYGLAGIVVAFAFAWICRDTPRDHPLCNESERILIEAETPVLDLQNATIARSATGFENEHFPLIPVLTSISLWGNSLTQFLTNIGWLFVVTWLPRYLGDVHQVPLQEQATMTAVPTIAGIAGMLCGGRWTDVAARRLGLKWGRCLPITVTRFTAASGYGLCLALGMLYAPDATSRWLPWMIIFGLSVATFSCDLGVPAMWAYSQDVGGKYTASIMGWGNMHGNFGAAVAPIFYNLILGETPTLAQWNILFAFCAVVFALSGVVALMIDGTKMIVNQNQSQMSQ
jgi:MFS family permease